MKEVVFMYTHADVGHTGEHIVTNWLSEKGYVTHLLSKGPDAIDIEAQGQISKLLVQVRSAIEPELPKSLSNNDEIRIKSHAVALGYIPWEAKIQLDNELRMIGKIQWRRLI
jgi:hypothetical protein